MPFTTSKLNGAGAAVQCDIAATARRMLYDWHGGQASALYSAASSGLVEDSNRLLAEIEDIEPEDDAQRAALDWLKGQLVGSKTVEVQGREYLALPWCYRT